MNTKKYEDYLAGKASPVGTAYERVLPKYQCPKFNLFRTLLNRNSVPRYTLTGH